jgi:hypothetical protein
MAHEATGSVEGWSQAANGWIAGAWVDAAVDAGSLSKGSDGLKPKAG